MVTKERSIENEPQVQAPTNHQRIEIQNNLNQHLKKSNPAVYELR